MRLLALFGFLVLCACVEMHTVESSRDRAIRVLQSLLDDEDLARKSRGGGANTDDITWPVDDGMVDRRLASVRGLLSRPRGEDPGNVRSVDGGERIEDEYTTERDIGLETKSGEKLDETVRVNTKERTELFDDKSQGMKVMHDFNQVLTAYRMTDDKTGSHYCVLTKLETDKVQSPEDTFDAINKDKVDRSKIQAVMYRNSTEDEDDDDDDELIATVHYQISKVNVEDRHFLGREMRELCEGVPLFRAKKSSKPVHSRNTALVRRKRWWKTWWKAAVCVVSFKVPVLSVAACAL